MILPHSPGRPVEKARAAEGSGGLAAAPHAGGDNYQSGHGAHHDGVEEDFQNTEDTLLAEVLDGSGGVDHGGGARYRPRWT